MLGTNLVWPKYLINNKFGSIYVFHLPLIKWCFLKKAHCFRIFFIKIFLYVSTCQVVMNSIRNVCKHWIKNNSFELETYSRSTSNLNGTFLYNKYYNMMEVCIQLYLRDTRKIKIKQFLVPAQNTNCDKRYISMFIMIC